MRVVLFLAIFVASAFAAPHPRAEPCSAPKQWRADTSSYDAFTKYARGYAIYDAIGKRIRYFDRIDSGSNSTRAAYDNLYLYEKKIHYRIDLKTQECIKLDLNRSFLPVEVQPNSTFIGEVTIGTLNKPGSGVLVQLWDKVTPNGVSLQSFTVDGCAPVEYLFVGNNGESNVNFHFLYYNVEPGINNPEEAFEVPKQCPM